MTGYPVGTKVKTYHGEYGVIIDNLSMQYYIRCLSGNCHFVMKVASELTKVSEHDYSRMEKSLERS